MLGETNKVFIFDHGLTLDKSVKLRLAILHVIVGIGDHTADGYHVTDIDTFGVFFKKVGDILFDVFVDKIIEIIGLILHDLEKLMDPG